ncbi:hypothetical protein Q1695_007746 [Nippostrongylus brasiliensis]|nr:hypothetical protein Q1695_007746 [Nippostrongylus brasiliensis]
MDVRLVVILLWTSPLAIAITCFSGATYNNSAAPTQQMQCPVIKYCTKMTAVMPVVVSSYGCDQSATLCKSDDCYDNQNGGKTCCCSVDLCNHSSSYLSLASLMAAMTYFMNLQ